MPRVNRFMLSFIQACSMAVILLGTAWASAEPSQKSLDQKPSGPFTLGPKVQRQIKGLVQDLVGKDSEERLNAEMALANFGPAARKWIVPLKGSKDEGIQQAAERLLALSTLSKPQPRVRFEMKRGSIELILFSQDAPKSCAHFLDLAGKRFYDGLRFHRVVERFMIQCGDPTNTGRGGPGFLFEDEISAEALRLDKITVRQLTKKIKMRSVRNMKAVGDLTLKELYEKQGVTFVKGLHSHPVIRGSVAMANTGPNTNGSQFFIAQIDCPWLNGKNTVFGQVIRGLDLVDSIQVNDKVLRVEVLDSATADHDRNQQD